MSAGLGPCLPDRRCSYRSLRLAGRFRGNRHGQYVILDGRLVGIETRIKITALAQLLKGSIVAAIRDRIGLLGRRDRAQRPGRCRFVGTRQALLQTGGVGWQESEAMQISKVNARQANLNMVGLLVFELTY